MIFKTMVFNSNLELVETLTYGAEQMIPTHDGKLLLFAHIGPNNKTIVVLNPRLVEIQRKEISTHCERPLQVGSQQFYCLGSTSTSWDAKTNETAEMRWLRYSSVGIVLHDGRLVVSRTETNASEIAVYEKPVFGKESRKVARLQELLLSRWDNSLMEVKSGVVAFQGANDKLIIWDVDRNLVTKHQLPPNGFLRCFVFE